MTLTRVGIVRIRPTSFLLQASTHAPKRRDSHAQTNIKRSERKSKPQMSRNLDGVGVSLAFPARSIDAPLWMMQRFERAPELPSCVALRPHCFEPAPSFDFRWECACLTCTGAEKKRAVPQAPARGRAAPPPRLHPSSRHQKLQKCSQRCGGGLVRNLVGFPSPLSRSLRHRCSLIIEF